MAPQVTQKTNNKNRDLSPGVDRPRSRSISIPNLSDSTINVPFLQRPVSLDQYTVLVLRGRHIHRTLRGLRRRVVFHELLLGFEIGVLVQRCLYPLWGSTSPAKVRNYDYRQHR